MTLAAGTKLGLYEIAAPLGAGGMGEVYRARDTKLGRDVALKVLPEDMARDPQRMGRFGREARTLASLNHSNIAAIYGLEESSGVSALVMELVEGETLAEHIARASNSRTSSFRTSSSGGRAGLQPEECLGIARQIAEALEYAHERGVIHRDLKPANVKITPEGAVKVLDFGLAKVLSNDDSAAVDPSNSPTLSAMATQEGIILGTAAYMAPEQAKGRPVDRRADIWAFGCVLYEMLAGQKAFEGETISDVLAAVIRAEPDWTLLPETMPPSIQRLIRRCLNKDPKQRLRDIGDARIAIEETLAGDADALTSQAAGTGARGGRGSMLRRALPWVLAGAGIVAAGALFVLRRPSQQGPPLRKFELNAGDLAGSYSVQPEISPDGKAIAYVSGKDLYVRDLDALEPRKLYSLSRANAIFWSPDSQAIGFADQGKLWQIPAVGGAPRQICTLPGRIISGAWGADGTIYFSAWRGDMYKVSAEGGDAKALGLRNPKTEVDFHALNFLPDGRDLIYIAHLVTGHSRIEVLAGGKQKAVSFEGGWDAWSSVYSPTGHLILMRVFGNAASIWAVPFSLRELKATGRPFMIAGNSAFPSVSADGTLVYGMAPTPGERQLVWVDRSGKIDSTIGAPQKGLNSPALSPHGKRIAVVAMDSSGKRNLFVYNMANGVMTPLLATAPGNDQRETTIFDPVWTPDGDSVLFTASHTVTDQKIMLVSPDGSGQPREVLTGVLGQLSPHGNQLAYLVTNENGTTQACYATFKDAKLQDTAAKPLCRPSASATHYWGPRISPDGHYVAFVTNSEGPANVYVAHFPDGNGRRQVSMNGGYSPLWSRRGDELYYLSGNELMSVRVTTQPSLSLGAPVKLFSLSDEHLVDSAPTVFSGPAFDISTDGKRFLMVQRVGEKSQPRLVVDQNWFAEFSKKSGN